MFRRKRNRDTGKNTDTKKACGCTDATLAAQCFSTVDEFEAHSDEEWDKGNDHGSYTQVPSDPFWVVDGKHWVVDVPAREEQGHWEYK